MVLLASIASVGHVSTRCGVTDNEAASFDLPLRLVSTRGAIVSARGATTTKHRSLFYVLNRWKIHTMARSNLP